MSLDWNVAKVDEQWWKGEDNPEWEITNGLIWATIGVDIGQITEQNYEKFHQRLTRLEQEMGHLMNAWEGGEIKPYYFTLEDVQRRIGLSTNVTTLSDREYEAKRKRIAAREGSKV